MMLARTASALRRLLPDGEKSTLVATMGGLHDGHLALVRRARAFGDKVVVSVYVNPLQFGVNEDFADYPRRLREDCEKLQGLADIVYAPTDDEMYPQQQTVGISLPPLADELCGKSRPGFFHGVAVVVCKLLNQVRPTRAIFGRKDYQQAVLMRLMTKQLSLPTEIVLHPIVRAADGLALSSRNEYLSATQRRQAAALPTALKRAATNIANGGDDFAAVCSAGAESLTAAGMDCDYFEVRDADDLSPPSGGKVVILAAATLGRVRLIDNIETTPFN